VELAEVVELVDADEVEVALELGVETTEETAVTPGSEMGRLARHAVATAMTDIRLAPKHHFQWNRRSID
jgi:hypothetical protein